MATAAPGGALHPAIRVLLLLALASALPAMSLPALALLALAVVLVYLRRAASALARLRGGVWRLRWLMLAIFVLYAGFTPGEPVLTALPGISREGLFEGTRRALVLIALLEMVYLLLALTPVAELAGAIRLLLGPLRALGVDPQRIGLRLALALDAVGDMHARVRGQARSANGGWARATSLLERIEADADAPAAPVEVPVLLSPPWWQWLLPLLLAIGLHRWTP